ncbi:MAG: SIR2 family protein [Clostridiaceae bacterium]
MSVKRNINLSNEINELINQLSVSKRIGFFLGAGTSKALGLPDIYTLTNDVEKKIKAEYKSKYVDVKKNLIESMSGKKITIEDMLNHIRLIREVTNGHEQKNFDGINGVEARKIDIAICNEIYRIIAEKEKKINLMNMKKFISWINWLSRDYSKEIFTPNYDLVIEKSLESLKIPYFDGFVGAHEPYFLPESIECKDNLYAPPISWIRLWKIHGSFGWFWKETDTNGAYKVVRLGVNAKCDDENVEIVIYPSRDKYESSRKQPFIAYFDRLKHFLQEGEGILIICGYSFSDQHINEVFFDALKQNNRLHIIVFLYSDDSLDKIKDISQSFLNISVYSATQSIIGGFWGEWKIDEDIKDERGKQFVKYYWDSDNNKLKLGDFNSLVDFLIEASGKRRGIEKEIGDKDGE